jgi:hypothetical protein
MEMRLICCARHGLSKLRAKGLVEKIPQSRRYCLLQEGYRVSVVFLELFVKIYAPLITGLKNPCPGDENIPDDRISDLDKRYLDVTTALNNLVDAVGLKAA